MDNEIKFDTSESCYLRFEGENSKEEAGELRLPNGSQLTVNRSLGESTRSLEEAGGASISPVQLDSLKRVCVLESKPAPLEDSAEPPRDAPMPSKSILKKARPPVDRKAASLSNCQKLASFITCGITRCCFQQKAEKEPLLSGAVTTYAPNKRVRFEGALQAPNMATKRPIQHKLSSRSLSMDGSSLRIQDLPYTLAIDKTRVSSEECLDDRLSQWTDPETASVVQHYLVELSHSAPFTTGLYEKEELSTAGMHLETLPGEHRITLVQFPMIKGDQEVTVYKVDSNRTVAVCDREGAVQKMYNWKEEVRLIPQEGEVSIVEARHTQKIQ